MRALLGDNFLRRERNGATATIHAPFQTLPEKEMCALGLSHYALTIPARKFPKVKKYLFRFLSSAYYKQTLAPTSVHQSQSVGHPSVTPFIPFPPPDSNQSSPVNSVFKTFAPLSLPSPSAHSVHPSRSRLIFTRHCQPPPQFPTKRTTLSAQVVHLCHSSRNLLKSRSIQSLSCYPSRLQLHCSHPTLHGLRMVDVRRAVAHATRVS